MPQTPIYTSIVGMNYRFKKLSVLNSNFQKLKLGTKLELKREPTNAHDKNAIAVYVGKLKFGYVPAYYAKEIKNKNLQNYNFFVFDFKGWKKGFWGIPSTSVIGFKKTKSQIDFAKQIVTTELANYSVIKKKKKFQLSSDIIKGNQIKISKVSVSIKINSLKFETYDPYLMENAKEIFLSKESESFVLGFAEYENYNGVTTSIQVVTVKS